MMERPLQPSKMRGIESAAMVLCGTGPDGKVELVTPPEGAPNGERVTFDAFEGEADEQLNPKKKVFEAVAPGFSGAFYTLVPIRPRRRGERRSLRTLPGVSLRPPLAFNPRHRRLSTPTDAFQLHPDVRSYGTTLRAKSSSP